jgi:hypothetical protein
MNSQPHPTPPRVIPGGVSARFGDRRAASRATRSLQREHGLPTEAIGVSMEPGPDAAEVGGRGGYLGVTKGGAVIVNVAVADEATLSPITSVARRWEDMVRPRTMGDAG